MSPVSAVAGPAEPTIRLAGSRLDALLAGTLLLIIGAHLRVGSATGVLSGFTVGGVLAVLAAPLWIPCITRYFDASTVLIVGAVAVLSGLALSFVATSTNTVGQGQRIDDLMVLVDLLTGVGVALWARTVMTNRAWILAYSMGVLLSTVISPEDGAAANPWKYGLAVAAALVLLGIVEGHPYLELAALGFLAIVSVAADSRAYSATFALAGVLILWQRRSQRGPTSVHWVPGSLVLAGLGYATYLLGNALLVHGVLGRTAQQRTIAQIDTAGNVILGGRPELAASLALFRRDPLGIGVGVAPSADQIQVAKRAMAAINYNPDNNYVDNFMFGGHVELHSVAGDLWARFGLMGLTFAVLITLLAVKGLVQRLVRHDASGLVLFVLLWTLWNIPFSPLLAAQSTLLLAITLSVRPREPSLLRDQ